MIAFFVIGCRGIIPHHLSMKHRSDTGDHKVINVQRIRDLKQNKIYE